ncbi:MAG: GyrI-like domain-containing protein [Bacillota bacterium]|jgi:effector-binding domain-containing protein
MIKIELIQQKVQPVLSIRTRTKVEELPNLIGRSYHSIMDYLKEMGEEPAGAPFTAYYNQDMQDLDVEMGFPVAKTLLGKGEIKAGNIPEGKAASAMYKGSYKKMEQPYMEMAKWISENGYEPTGVAYEYYYNSPDEVPESELLTRIVMPLK